MLRGVRETAWSPKTYGKNLMKVLVADDDARVRDELSGLLRQHGFEVIEARTGTEALLHARQSNPDAVILDYIFDVPAAQRMDGDEVLREIRRLDAHLPVVMCSSMIDEQAFYDLGAAAVVPKPFYGEVLKSVMEALGQDASSIINLNASDVDVSPCLFA